VEAGETGELVVTTLCKEAAPLIRYRTRDLTRLLPGVCACGLNLPRHGRIHARSDDMFILRGVNIYPGQIMDTLACFPELGGEWHVTLTRANGRDSMELAAERRSGVSAGMDQDLAARVEERLGLKLMVRSRVRIVDHGSLPRTVGKSKRITDLR
jgi:phenylacetate-CoA ligase